MSETSQVIHNITIRVVFHNSLDIFGAVPVLSTTTWWLLAGDKLLDLRLVQRVLSLERGDEFENRGMAGADNFGEFAMPSFDGVVGLRQSINDGVVTIPKLRRKRQSSPLVASIQAPHPIIFEIIDDWLHFRW